MHSEEFVIDTLDAALEDPARRLGAGVARERVPIEVLRFYTRSLRIGRLPLLSSALSAVAVARTPEDLIGRPDRDRETLKRVAEVSAAIYPPWRGLSIGLTLVTIFSEPIGPELSTRLAAILGELPRWRCTALGFVALNLSDETMAYSFLRVADALFPEPQLVIDALAPHYRQFVPLIDPASP